MTDFNNNEGMSKIKKDMEILNKEVAPFLEKKFNDFNVDYKSSVIFFISVSGLLLEEIDNDNFSKLMLQYFKKVTGAQDVL